MARPIVENDERPDVRWNRTVRALERVQWQLEMRNLPGYGQVAFFKGRHVIGRDMQVVDGVYLGTYAREAIVVSEKDGVLPSAYRGLIGRLGRNPEQLDELVVMRVLHAYVRELLPGGMQATDVIIRNKIGSTAQDEEIELSTFVIGKAGICRHRALLGTYFVEKLIKDGIRTGTRSIDRNEMDSGGHAWTRFVSDRTGQILISDAGLDECGDIFAIEQAWGYRRPEDQKPIPRVDRSPRPEPKGSKPLIDNIDRTAAVIALLWAAWHFGLSRLL